jgi:hypothetical protein
LIITKGHLVLNHHRNLLHQTTVSESVNVDRRILDTKLSLIATNDPYLRADGTLPSEENAISFQVPIIPKTSQRSGVILQTVGSSNTKNYNQ